MGNDQYIGKCCRDITGSKTVVVGEGPFDARVMLIGQNPGAEEDRLGRPFVGRSGKYLGKVLKENGIERSSLFITSVVKCKTPKNGKPTATEIENCLPYLVEQIKRIGPKLIVLMGQVAWGTPRLEGIQFMETFHPAAAMRFPKIRQKFEADFRKLSLMPQLTEKRSRRI